MITHDVNWDKFIGTVANRHVILDVDGVLADFKGHLLKSVGSKKHSDEFTDYHVIEVLEPDERELAYQLLRMPTWWEQIPLIPGAQKAVELIRECSLSVVFATAPWVSCKGWEHMRREYLKQHFGAKNDDVFPISQKDRIVGHVIVEDKAENVKKFHYTPMNRFAWLYHQNYNKDFDWPFRINWPV